jgi:hypothetical protein
MKVNVQPQTPATSCPEIQRVPINPGQVDELKCQSGHSGEQTNPNYPSGLLNPSSSL